MISSTNTHSKGEDPVKFCRPWATQNIDPESGEERDRKLMEYWVDAQSMEKVELGTIEYPFKNVNPPAKEVFNYIHDKIDYNINLKRGGTTKMYYGLAPVICLNLGSCAFHDYGDPELPKPYMYLTDHAYIWWPGSVFTMEEKDYFK